MKDSIKNIYINLLTILNNKLVMSNSSKFIFYEKYIRWQLSNVIIYILYEHSDIKKSITLLWSNRVLILSSIIFFFILFLSYNVGSKSNEDEMISNSYVIKHKSNIINSLTNTIYENRLQIRSMNNKIEQIYHFKKSRKWIEYLIYSEAKIYNFNDKMDIIDNNILTLMYEQANKYNIPYSIYFRLIDVESKFKFVINKKSGASGYMQIMPRVFNKYCVELGLNGIDNKRNNILVGSYILYKEYTNWLKRGKSNKMAWKYTLAEYNGGIVKMRIIENDKIVGYRIPTYTIGYINSIMKIYNMYN